MREHCCLQTGGSVGTLAANQPGTSILEQLESGTKGKLVIWNDGRHSFGIKVMEIILTTTQVTPLSQVLTKMFNILTF